MTSQVSARTWGVARRSNSISIERQIQTAIERFELRKRKKARGARVLANVIHHYKGEIIISGGAR